MLSYTARIEEHLKRCTATPVMHRGIRHALLQEPTLDSDDARFMLVSCSAFVNYLKTKANHRSVMRSSKVPMDREVMHYSYG